MKPKQKIKRDGFTLLEVILYSAIVAVMVVAISTTVVLLTQTRQKKPAFGS
jgi:type II secretory pathway pseudopilin PulG